MKLKSIAWQSYKTPEYFNIYKSLDVWRDSQIFLFCFLKNCGVYESTFSYKIIINLLLKNAIRQNIHDSF